MRSSVLSKWNFDNATQTVATTVAGQSDISMNQFENFRLRRVSLTCSLRVGVNAARFSIHQLVRVPVTSPFPFLFLSLFRERRASDMHEDRTERMIKRERKERGPVFLVFHLRNPMVPPVVFSRYLRTMRCVRIFILPSYTRIIINDNNN